MTEKRYKMVNTNLVDDDGLVYYLIKKDGRDVCQVFGKHTAKAIVTELNSLHEENGQLKHQNELLSDELEQCKAVINKKWSEYLQKKEIEND